MVHDDSVNIDVHSYLPAMRALSMIQEMCRFIVRSRTCEDVQAACALLLCAMPP